MSARPPRTLTSIGLKIEVKLTREKDHKLIRSRPNFPIYSEINGKARDQTLDLEHGRKMSDYAALDCSATTARFII